MIFRRTPGSFLILGFKPRLQGLSTKMVLIARFEIDDSKCLCCQTYFNFLRAFDIQ